MNELIICGEKRKSNQEKENHKGNKSKNKQVKLYQTKTSIQQKKSSIK